MLGRVSFLGKCKGIGRLITSGSVLKSKTPCPQCHSERRLIQYHTTVFLARQGIRRFHVDRVLRLPIVSFHLSDIGEGIKEVELTEWFINEGDSVEQFDSICEVKSDKASVTITSRFDGVVKKIHHEVDSVVQVGDALVDIETSSDDTAGAQEEEEGSEEVLVEDDDNKMAIQSKTKVLATPAVRSLASKNGIDITKIQGSGPQGRVTKEDIFSHMKPMDKISESNQVPPPTPVATVPSGQDTVEPIKGIRKVMFVNMIEANKIPHFGYDDEYDLTNLVSVRKDLKNAAKKHDIKLSYLPFILKAVSMSLLEYPILNSSISEDQKSIIYKTSHNIGIAVDSPHGLLMPCIKNVQSRSILEIAGEIGGTYAHPVIFPPQVAIGALGKIQVLPRFDHHGELTKAHIMCVSWSADHRVIEGATMARFSNNIKYLLEDPSRMIFYLK